MPGKPEVNHQIPACEAIEMSEAELYKELGILTKDKHKVGFHLHGEKGIA